MLTRVASVGEIFDNLRSLNLAKWLIMLTPNVKDYQ